MTHITRSSKHIFASRGVSLFLVSVTIKRFLGGSPFLVNLETAKGIILCPEITILKFTKSLQENVNTRVIS